MNAAQYVALRGFLPPRRGDWRLLLDTTVDGGVSNAIFHEKCDGKGVPLRATSDVVHAQLSAGTQRTQLSSSSTPRAASTAVTRMSLGTLVAMVKKVDGRRRPPRSCFASRVQRLPPAYRSRCRSPVPTMGTLFTAGLSTVPFSVLDPTSSSTPMVAFAAGWAQRTRQGQRGRRSAARRKLRSQRWRCGSSRTREARARVCLRFVFCACICALLSLLASGGGCGKFIPCRRRELKRAHARMPHPTRTYA